MIECQKISKSSNDSSFNFDVEIVIDNLEVPWGMVFLPDGSMIISEKKGELIHFKDGKKSEIGNLPKVRYDSEGGLLDLELHPNYENNGWIYLSFAGNIENDNKGANTTIMRAKLYQGELVDQEIIYKAMPNTKEMRHYGSRMEFDENGFLFFSIGDRLNRSYPQSIYHDGGKIYRLKDDGSIPEDNPFVGTKGAIEAIYSYGHRNPQGMAMNPGTGEIWIHEHGPKGGDEINIIFPGKNYGWPEITHGINYDNTSITDNTSLPGFEKSFHYWVPSIAPCGMAFLNSDIYPEWKNSLLVGSLVFQYLNLITLENEKVIKEEKLLEGMGRVRNVRIGPDGYIYIAIEQLGIVRLIPC